MTETSIGYRWSPLNGPDRVSTTHVGDRMPPVAGEVPYGAGETPRFTLRAGRKADAAALAGFGALLDQAVRPSSSGDDIELVRPDGYLAVSAPGGDSAAIAGYLRRFARR
jgi:hypothetical protein